MHILFSSSYYSPTTIAPQATAPPVPQRAYGKEDVGLAEYTDINAVMALSQGLGFLLKLHEMQVGRQHK